jgi:hypothetical protein
MHVGQVLGAIIAVLPGCGPSDSRTDAGASTDSGPLDGGSDAASDGGLPFPECAEGFADLPWLKVRVDGHDLIDEGGRRWPAD